MVGVGPYDVFAVGVIVKCGGGDMGELEYIQSTDIILNDGNTHVPEPIPLSSTLRIKGV